MKNNKVVFLLLFIGGLLSWYYWHAPATSSAHIKNELRVGTSPDFPPFAFINDQGQIDGFDINIAQEVCKRLGKDMVLVDRPFTSLILDLKGGSIDLIASGMTPTPERGKHVLFSLVYLEGSPLIVVSKTQLAAQKVEDILDKKIIVSTGYTADTYISEYNPQYVVRLKSPADALVALDSGVGEIYITALNAFADYAKKHPELFVWKIPNTGETCALLIGKENEKLQTQINQALQSMLDDGTIAALKTKWLASSDVHDA